VAIHLNLPLSLIALLHPGPVATDAIAAAQLLPPMTLGDGSNSFGDQTENVTQGFAGLTSPNELQERGDPYTTLCELGWSEASDQGHVNATSNSYYTTQSHVPTNKPQYPSGPNCSPGNPGNPDQMPAGFGGLATRNSPVSSGASYLITIPKGGAGYSVWVWNPRLVYRGSNTYNTLFTQENI
jgi:hypothetical protein